MDTIHFKFFSFKRSITINRKWLQFGIIASVILLSTIISFWGSQRIFLLLLFLLGGIGVTLALLRQPNLGFVLVLLGGMFVQFTGPSGLNAATVLIALMFGLWVLDMFIVQRSFQFVHSKTMLPIIVFLIISVLAFLIGQIPWFVFARQAPLDAQVGGFSVFIFSIGGLLLSAHLIKNVRWLKVIVWTFLGLSAIYILSRVIRLEEIYSLYNIGYTAQSMSWTWLVALALSQFLFNNKLVRHIKWILLALIVFTLYVALFTGYGWKSGWVPPLVAAVVLIGLRYRKLTVFVSPLLIIGVVIVVMDLIGSEDYSWGTRVDAWLIILEISRVSPLLGMGFANYYWYTPLFPIRGCRVSFNSHSQFVDLIAQTGYIGLLAFIWLFFEFGRLAWNLTKQLPPGFPRAYAYGVFAGICASMVAAFLGDWMLPFVYNVGLAGFRASILPWIFIGGAISLEQMLRRGELKQDEVAITGNSLNRPALF
ncbi:MAG TPA: hypothetical protein V6D48_02150 [Oculatellaceae cyanobacterium]